MPHVFWLPVFELEDGKPLHFTTSDRDEAEAHLERGAILGAKTLLFKLKLDRGWLHVEQVARRKPSRVASEPPSEPQAAPSTPKPGNAQPV